MVNGATTGVKWISSSSVTVNVYVGKAGLVPIQLQNPGTLWGPVFNAQFVASGPPPATTISPASASVNLGATQQFISNNATSWSATAGTIVNGLYTAPATMPASSKVTVTATGPGGSASATVTLVNPNAQQISPVTVTLNLGATQQFTSTWRNIMECGVRYRHWRWSLHRARHFSGFRHRHRNGDWSRRVRRCDSHARSACASRSPAWEPILCPSDCSRPQ